MEKVVRAWRELQQEQRLRKEAVAFEHYAKGLLGKALAGLYGEKCRG